LASVWLPIYGFAVNTTAAKPLVLCEVQKKTAECFVLPLRHDEL
jgi:hypothetical protein